MSLHFFRTLSNITFEKVLLSKVNHSKGTEEKMKENPFVRYFIRNKIIFKTTQQKFLINGQRLEATYIKDADGCGGFSTIRKCWETHYTISSAKSPESGGPSV